MPGLNLSPKAIFGFLLRQIQYVGRDVAAIVGDVQGAGDKARQIGDVLQVLDTADADFQAGKIVTGSVSIYGHAYTYNFTPKA